MIVQTNPKSLTNVNVSVTGRLCCTVSNRGSQQLARNRAAAAVIVIITSALLVVSSGNRRIRRKRRKCRGPTRKPPTPSRPRGTSRTRTPERDLKKMAGRIRKPRCPTCSSDNRPKMQVLDSPSKAFSCTCILL